MQCFILTVNFSEDIYPLLLEFWTNPIKKLASMGRTRSIGAGVEGCLMVVSFNLRASAGVSIEWVAAYGFLYTNEAYSVLID